MNRLLVCITVLLAVLLCFPDDTNGFLWRRRRVVNNYHGTRNNCNYRMNGNKWVYNGKRSVSDEAAPPIPCDFKVYDDNNDGSISSYEFDAKTRFVNLDQVMEVFKLMDKDGQNGVSRKEFDEKSGDLEKHNVFEHCKGQ